MQSCGFPRRGAARASATEEGEGGLLVAWRAPSRPRRISADQRAVGWRAQRTASATATVVTGRTRSRSTRRTCPVPRRAQEGEFAGGEGRERKPPGRVCHVHPKPRTTCTLTALPERVCYVAFCHYASSSIKGQRVVAETARALSNGEQAARENAPRSRGGAGSTCRRHTPKRRHTGVGEDVLAAGTRHPTHARGWGVTT